MLDILSIGGSNNELLAFIGEATGTNGNDTALKISIFKNDVFRKLLLNAIAFSYFPIYVS